MLKAVITCRRVVVGGCVLDFSRLLKFLKLF